MIGVLQTRDGLAKLDEEPQESAIHRALLVRQRDAGAIGVKDDDGLVCLFTGSRKSTCTVFVVRDTTHWQRTSRK